MKRLALIALAALSAAYAAPMRTATEGYVDRTVAAATNGLADKADAAYSAAESLADGVNSLAGTIGTHIRDTKNPHKVTAAQVGALPISGGTLTGDLAVGEEHTASRKLTVASESDANGITLQGGKSNGNGSRVFVGGSTGSGGTIIIEGGGTVGGRLYVGNIAGAGGGAIEVSGTDASIKKDGKEVATESYVDAKVEDAVLPTNPTFSNAVLSVGLNIDTNSVAVLNEIADTFGGFPIEGTATTVGGLLAALAAAIAWLKKNKVGSFASVGGASATVENGVAKLDDFFTASNSLLTGTIDAEVISKGTAPDAHLEAPTDEHLKLILADNSVAYDSAKALPYKLTSVIGDRVIATMTLTAASTDITLPTITANDTTVKDFILDVTNAYAVEGVATDAGINIPRTDFKLVTRDGESLTDVTTVKAGKSAFICFTQKSPVVVGGTTYPCWCVIQLPFGDPS